MVDETVLLPMPQLMTRSCLLRLPPWLCKISPAGLPPSTWKMWNVIASSVPAVAPAGKFPKYMMVYSYRMGIAIGYVYTRCVREDETLTLPFWDQCASRTNHYLDNGIPLHGLDLHVAGWESFNRHDPGHVSWVGSVLYRSCATSRKGRRGTR